MAGDRDKGRELIDENRDLLEELGQHVSAASTRMLTASPDLFAGRPERAEKELRRGYEVLEQMGEKGHLSTIAALLALALCGQGRHDEAESYVQTARELGAADDLTTEVYWRCAQAETRASRREFDEALRVLDEAQQLVGQTDFFAEKAAPFLSRAVVEQAAGNSDSARSALEQAVELFEQKGDLTAAMFARERLAAL